MSYKAAIRTANVYEESRPHPIAATSSSNDVLPKWRYCNAP